MLTLATSSILLGNGAGLVILAVLLVGGIRAIRKWGDFCDRQFENSRKTGLAVFVSPALALAAIIAFRITSQAHYHIGDSPVLTFLVWFALVGTGIAFWFGVACSLASR